MIPDSFQSTPADDGCCGTAFAALDPSAVIDVMEVVRRAALHGLVQAGAACPGIAVELRYAGNRNFTGAPLYPAELPCLLHSDTAAKLNRARSILAAAGCELLVWDAWRPPEAQVLLWNRVQDPAFVARPAAGKRWSWHCYGRAVDVALVRGDTGELLPLPSDLDDFTVRGRAGYAGTDAAVAGNLERLQSAMVEPGFHGIDSEWWHFSDPAVPVPASPVWGRDLGLSVQPP